QSYTFQLSVSSLLLHRREKFPPSSLVQTNQYPKVLAYSRLEKCNQDILDYVQEFRDFSRRMISRLEGLKVYKAEFKNEVEHLLTRVERAQRDIDYFQSTRESTACVEVDEDIVEKQLNEDAEEKRKVKLMLNASCDNMLAGIKSIKIVKKTGDMHGSWMTDPGKDHMKIYFLSGSKNNVILEFANIRAFTERNHKLTPRRVNLPSSWQGTGHVMYNGFLKKFKIFRNFSKMNIKISLRSMTQVLFSVTITEYSPGFSICSLLGALYIYIFTHFSPN
uniref:Olfactomedin like 1 n=1 Tax=Terrapene triunguis TaxID=2587831 RepID=A0A674IF62_9SAUR